MSNQILTISEITRESLRVLENELAFTKGVNRQYDDKFAVEGAKIGDTINIRLPARYVGRTGQVINIEDQTETSIPLQLNTQRGVDLAFTSKDRKLSLDDFSERVLKPALANIGNGIDRDGLIMAANSVYNAVGTPGVTPNTAFTFLSAGAKLDFEAAPKEGRTVIMDPLCEASMVDALKGLFQDSGDIAKQYRKGRLGMALGYDWTMDQNIQQHTIGALGGTPTMSTLANQTGSSILTTGWTATTGAVAAGDIFTIAGVYAVNPQSRQSTNQLRQFLVTAAATANGSGNMTINIFPAIVPPISTTISAQYQNVSAAPAGSAAITILGSAAANATCNMVYHKDSFVLGCADLPLPDGVDLAARARSKKTGLSIRVVSAYDITNDRFITRLDVLYGWAPLYPQLACGVKG
jgi:hypothetical protein